MTKDEFLATAWDFVRHIDGLENPGIVRPMAVSSEEQLDAALGDLGDEALEMALGAAMYIHKILMEENERRGYVQQEGNQLIVPFSIPEGIRSVENLLDNRTEKLN